MSVDVLLIVISDDTEGRRARDLNQVSSGAGAYVTTITAADYFMTPFFCRHGNKHPL